jgi:two-component system, LytTR family, response regulator
LLKALPDVELVGEAANGKEALDLIEQTKPDVALLDLQMPELGGLDVARLLKAGASPVVAFVTAFDEFAVQAFELNAVDYLLKPVERDRLIATLDRARTRAKSDAGDRARSLQSASAAYDIATRRTYLDRIPVRRRDEVVIVPVRQIASVVAEGELLHITTVQNERYTITYRLHALEARLDPRRFVRLGRGTLAATDLIQKVSPMPGGTCQVTLVNGQQLQVSRLQSRVLRETLLRL